MLNLPRPPRSRISVNFLLSRVFQREANEIYHRTGDQAYLKFIRGPQPTEVNHYVLGNGFVAINAIVQAVQIVQA